MILTQPNTLSEQQRQELEVVKKTTKDIRVYRRVKVILYRNTGYTPDEIRDHTDYSEREQRYIVCRYRHEGVAGLHDRPRSGRPRQDVSEKEAPPPLRQAGDVPPERKPDEEAASEAASEADSPKPVANLSDWARMTLECLQGYHPKRYLRNRAQMLLLRDDGYSAREIADILRVSVATVRQVCTEYDRHQLAGLYRKPGSGRPSTLRPEQWEQFATWVLKGPKALGYRFVKWTTRSLRKYILKRFNMTFSREWIRQKLHQFLEYSWTRGKTVYAYVDNEERNQDRRTFSRKMLAYLAQARAGEIMLLFADESIFTLFGEVGYSWSPQGKTQEVLSTGKRGRVVVFGAVDPLTGRPHYRLETGSINQESSLQFVMQLVRYYQKHAPGMPVVIVWDKHPGHTSGIVDEFVKAHPHVTLENTPTQSPDLNPIERLWDWLADLMIKNDFFERLDALKRAIRHFFCYIAGIKEQVIQCLGDLQTLYSAEAGMEAEI